MGVVMKNWADDEKGGGLVELKQVREEHQAQTSESETDRVLRVLRGKFDSDGKSKVVGVIKGTNEAGQEVYQIFGKLKHPNMETSQLPLLRMLTEDLGLESGKDVSAFRNETNVTITVSAEKLREKLPAIQRGGVAAAV
jgi:hypothetical protein